jgi:hypothetical protein
MAARIMPILAAALYFFSGRKTEWTGCTTIVRQPSRISRTAAGFSLTPSLLFAFAANAYDGADIANTAAINRVDLRMASPQGFERRIFGAATL